MAGPRPVGGKGETYILSNFYPCRVNVFGEVFKSGEATYQWRKAKFMGRDQVAQEILVAPHARETKDDRKRALGGAVQLARWEEGMRVKVMKEVLETKARGCEEFVSELRSTGEREIEEVVWDRRFGEFTG